MVKKKTGNRLKYLDRKKTTFGDKAADKLAEVAGSWGFIFTMAVFIGIWIWLNITAFVQHWDSWPFILLNLTLSSLAVFQAPIILMSQNRTSEKDRKRAEYDYKIDRKSHRQIAQLQKDVTSIKNLLRKKK